ncbi:MAG: heat-inducible transcriptional repressor HrcA [bacterium]|nr:heat-inducible transcriptional repressor HrcA [bacterium]
MEQLQQREEKILDTLVSAHISTGEPVGSRTIAKSGLSLSAATVRNSMADLEEKGFLKHPHTSAGRVPTDKGYRYYVDKVMAQEDLTEPERELIKQCILTQMREGNIERLVEQVSRVVADVSQNLGLALTPRFERGKFQRLEMVPLSDSKILLVLTIEAGLVKTMVMEIDAAIDPTDLEDTRRVVNERLAGLTVGEIRASVGERLRSVTMGAPRLLRLLMNNAESLFRFSSADDLHFGGAGNVFRQPEFSGNQSGIVALLGLLEAREPIASLLDERLDREGIAITIGNENASPELQGCSVLTSRYQVGNVSGVIGIIGPTRIAYARLVPLLKYISHLTEEFIEQS